MTKTSFTRSILILLIITLLLGSVIVTQAAPPHSVGLVSFEATALETSVRLEWESATELNTAGYIVKRSINSEAFIALPDIGISGFIDADGNPAGFVVGEGGPAEGGIYTETDNDVQAGNTYTYKLFEVENNFNEVELEVRQVSFGALPANTPTSTATATNTAVPHNNATSTSTSLATSTHQPTTTPLATATPTTQAANNVLATATATVILAPTSAPTATPTTQLVAAVASSSQESESNGGDENLSGGNVVFAQEEETATAVPPTPSLETNSSDDEYPGNSDQEPQTIDSNLEEPTPITLEEVPYPVATPRATNEQDEAPFVSVIGSQTSNQEENSAANPSQESERNRDAQLGRLYLWGGFLLSLLIFITTIVATILLFTRKRTQ